MGRVRTFLTITLCVLLGACAFIGRSTSLRETISPNLETGDQWSVEVRYWPDRFEDPYTRVDTPLVETNRYTVLETPPSATSRRILVESDTETFLLQAHASGNIDVASRILSEDTSGVVKTQQVFSNSLQGRAFFAPDWSPSRAVFLFHPDMTARKSHRRIRFDRESNYSGDWIVHTMDSSDTAAEITLRHKPSRSRVEFLWPRGAVWWKQARWFRSDRIVATARRIE